MLCAYGTANGCLTERPEGAASEMPAAIWLDLVEPTEAEEAAVEAALGIDIPTREELAEIEASSRLYQEDGAAFMTANLIRRGENDQPESSPVTFIIKDNTLITIRYHHPAGLPGLCQAGDEAADHRDDRLGHPDLACSKLWSTAPPTISSASARSSTRPRSKTFGTRRTLCRHRTSAQPRGAT